MNKTWIIIGGGILLIGVLGAAWWYLLMNGRPDSLADIPNPFAYSGDAIPTIPPANTGQPSTTGTLRKISEHPVAGAVILTHEDGTYVRYVERGTGYVYEVNTATGVSQRMTNTTIPRTISAVWSPQGSRVALVVETTGGEGRVFAGTIERTDSGAGALTTIELESTARNISFSPTGESIFYTAITAGGTTGYEYNLKTAVRSTRFTSPLRALVVKWEPTLLAYTTPTAQFRGYAYTGTDFTRLTGGAAGLMVIPAKNTRVLTYAVRDSLVSRVQTFDGVAVAVPLFPEKCATDKTENTILWCAAPLGLAAASYPDAWYEGSVSFDDALWQVDATTGGASMISQPSKDIGASIDVTDMQANDAGTMLIFINKKDGALWLQEV